MASSDRKESYVKINLNNKTNTGVWKPSALAGEGRSSMGAEILCSLK